MKRYEKANASIHTPEELKQSVLQTRSRSPIRWVSAVAAVLVIALVGGIVLWPEKTPIVAIANASTIYEATYPTMPAYPDESNFFGIGGKFDNEGFDKVYQPWAETNYARRTMLDGSGYVQSKMEAYNRATMAEFLSGRDGENRVYSPLNVYLALSMLAEITDGNTRQQILNLLGTDTIEAQRTLANKLWQANYISDGATASILASSLWLREDMDYVESTMETLSSSYYASSYRGEMGSAGFNKAVQDWLNQQTGGLLEEAAGDIRFDSETILALATTLYLKVRWNAEFSEQFTEDGTFHTAKKNVTVPFMHQGGSGTYYWGGKFSAISRPFVEGGSMWFILPDEGVTPEELLQDKEAMDFIVSDTKFSWQKSKHLIINQSIPKFDVSDSFDLNDGLKALGITDVFDPSVSDFSPTTAMEEIFLSTSTHAGRVVIDEEGCTAAAFTTMLVCGSGAPAKDEVDFIVDRPFLFVITSESGQLLFTGIVNHPLVD